MSDVLKELDKASDDRAESIPPHDDENKRFLTLEEIARLIQEARTASSPR
jgi:hypothetical protein